MEHFKQNLNSEDMSKEGSSLSEKEAILPAVNHIDEVLERQDDYLPAAIIASYEKNIATLQAEIKEIESYLTAKDREPGLSYQIEAWQASRLPTTTLAEKMSELEHYQEIIRSFEEHGVPAEVLANAKEVLTELQQQKIAAEAIARVAKEGPSLN